MRARDVCGEGWSARVTRVASMHDLGLAFTWSMKAKMAVKKGVVAPTAWLKETGRYLPNWETWS